MQVATVIPLYNHEGYIGEALGSLLAQRRPPDRIIVVDDGSTDGSLEAAQAVRDSRITVVSQRNAGAHAALNRGIGLAEGCDFVGILNSDDVYEPERIEKCVRWLEGNRSADVLVTRVRLIDEAGAIVRGDDARGEWARAVWEARPASLAGWLGMANFTKTTSNLFGRAEYFRTHPFRGYRYVHDYFFAVTAAVEDRLGVLDEELLRYRVHGANTIKSGAVDKLPREVLRMNVDLLRAFAPVLEKSPETRGRLAEYFRTLSLNVADFRFEPFLWLVAEQFAGLTDAELERLCDGLEPGRYPELLAGKSRALRERIAQGEWERLVQALGSSRWLALGRLFGASPGMFVDAPTAEGRLAALRKACAGSAWFRLGERLGFVYRGDV